MTTEAVFEQLRYVLEQSGMEQAKELLNVLEENELARDPSVFGGDQTGFKINSAEFMRAFLDSDASEVESNPNDLIIFPKMNNGQITGMNVYYSVDANDQKLITNKIGDFSLNLSPDTSGIVNTGGGSAVIEGTSINQHNIMSRTNEQAFYEISKAASSDFVYNTSRYHSNNPELLNHNNLVSVVKYDQYDHAKNYESHRVLALQSELKYEAPRRGIVPRSALNGFAGDDSLATYKYFDTFNQSSIGLKQQEILNSMGSKATKVDLINIINKTGEDSIKKSIRNIVTPRNFGSDLSTKDKILKNLYSNNAHFMSNKNKDIAKGIINNYLETNTNTLGDGLQDLDPLIDQIYSGLGLGNNQNINSGYTSKLVDQIFGTNSVLTKEQVSAALANSELGNVSMNNLNLAFNAIDKKYSGSEINSAFGISVGTGSFSMQDILNMDGTAGINLTDKQRQQLSVGYNIKDGNTFFTFGTINSGGSYEQQNLYTNFTETDTARIMEAQYKSRGLFISENMINKGMGSSEIAFNMDKINDAISQRDSSAFQKAISNLTDPSDLTMVREAFQKGELLNISNIVNKDKFKGISNTLGSAVYGDLGVMNKLGARLIQGRDVLSDFTTTTSNGLFNITEYMGNYYSYDTNNTGGIVRDSILRNTNAGALNQAENLSRARIEKKFVNQSDVSNRRTLQVMGFEIMDIMDESGKSDLDRLVGFDEASYVSEKVSKSLSGESSKVHRISLNDINTFLTGAIDGDATEEINKVSSMAVQDRAVYLDKQYGFFGGYFSHKEKTKESIEAYQAWQNEKIAAKSEGRQPNVAKKASLNANDLYYSRRTGAAGFEGMNFKHAFDVDMSGMEIAEDGGINMRYYDITRASAGTKIHGYSHTGKYTISGVMDELSIDGRQVGFVSASKGQKRAWGGGAITGFLRAGMNVSSESGKNADFLDALNQSGILEVLGLDISADGSVMRDTNVTSFKTPEDVLKASKNLINNPALKTKEGAKLLQDRMKGSGYGDWNDVLLDINRIYEGVMGDQLTEKNKLIGERTLTMNGREERVLGMLYMDSFAISGADQTFTFGNAIRMGMMESRMLGSKGLYQLDDFIRKETARKSSNFASQITSAGSVDGLVIGTMRNGKNSIGYDKAFINALEADESKNVVRINVDEAMGNMGTRTVGRYARNGSGSFQEFFGKDFDLISELRKTVDDPNSKKSLGIYKRLTNVMGSSGSDTMMKIQANVKAGRSPLEGVDSDQMLSEVRKNILKKGELASIDKNGALYNAYDTVSGKLDRSIPTLVFEGKGIDNLNKQLHSAFSNENLFKGDEILESSFKSYKDYLVNNTKKNNLTTSETQRRAFQSVLENYKANNNRYDVGMELLERIGDTKDFDEAARLINMMDGNFVNFHNLTSGLFTDQYGDEFLGGINRMFQNANDLSTLKNINAFETAMGKALTIEDSLERGKAINASIKELGLSKKDWSSMNKHEIAMFRDISKLSNKSNQVMSLLESINQTTEGSDSYYEYLNKLNLEIENSDYDIQTDEVATLNTNISKRKGNLTKELFKNIYTKEADIIESFTKKSSLLTENMKFSVDISLSGQWSEGSNLLNDIGRKVASDIEYGLQNNVKSVKSLNSYKDLSEVFGEDLTELLFFKDGEDVSGYGSLDARGNLDVSHSRRLQSSINDLEDVVLVNTKNVTKQNAKVGTAIGDGSVVNNALEKANIGIATRNPMQSSEHISMFAGLGIDLDNYTDDTKNFVIRSLRASGFGDSDSGMILGKRTAIKFGGDYDGDKFYFGLLDKQMEHLSSDKLQSIQKEMLVSFLASNEVDVDKNAKLLSKLGIAKDSESYQTLQLMKAYSRNSREMSAINVKDALSVHKKTVAAIYGNADATSAYKKLSSAGGDIDQLTESEKQVLTSAFKTRYGSVMSDDEILQDLSKNSQGGNIYETLSMLKKSFSGGNIDKSGSVYTVVNNLRNIETVLGTKEVNSEYINDIIKRAQKISGNNADYSESLPLFKDIAKGLGIEVDSDNVQTLKDEITKVLSKEQDNMRKYQGLSSMLSDNAIQMGVIDAKNDSEFIFSLLEKNAQDAMAKSGTELAKKTDQLNYLEVFGSRKEDIRDYSKLDKMLENIKGDGTSNSWKIIKTIADDKGVNLESGPERHMIAAMVFAGEENLRSMSSFNRTFQKITQKYDIVRKTGQGVINDLAKLIGIENVQLTRKGRRQNAWTASRERKNSLLLDEDEMILNNSKVDAAGSFVKDFLNKAKQSGTAQAVAGSIKDTASKAGETISKVSSSATGSIGAGIGALALGAFLGYNIGKSRVQTYNEQNYQDELGLGENELGYNFQSASDLGY